MTSSFSSSPSMPHSYIKKNIIPSLLSSLSLSSDASESVNISSSSSSSLCPSFDLKVKDQKYHLSLHPYFNASASSPSPSYSPASLYISPSPSFHSYYYSLHFSPSPSSSSSSSFSLSNLSSPSILQYYNEIFILSLIQYHQENKKKTHSTSSTSVAFPRLLNVCAPSSLVSSSLSLVSSSSLSPSSISSAEVPYFIRSIVSLPVPSSASSLPSLLADCLLSLHSLPYVHNIPPSNPPLPCTLTPIIPSTLSLYDEIFFDDRRLHRLWDEFTWRFHTLSKGKKGTKGKKSSVQKTKSSITPSYRVVESMRLEGGILIETIEDIEEEKEVNQSSQKSKNNDPSRNDNNHSDSPLSSPPPPSSHFSLVEKKFFSLFSKCLQTHSYQKAHSQHHSPYLIFSRIHSLVSSDSSSSLLDEHLVHKMLNDGVGMATYGDKMIDFASLLLIVNGDIQQIHQIYALYQEKKKEKIVSLSVDDIDMMVFYAIFLHVEGCIQGEREGSNEWKSQFIIQLLSLSPSFAFSSSSSPLSLHFIPSPTLLSSTINENTFLTLCRDFANFPTVSSFHSLVSSCESTFLSHSIQYSILDEGIIVGEEGGKRGQKSVMKDFRPFTDTFSFPSDFPFETFWAELFAFLAPNKLMNQFESPSSVPSSSFSLTPLQMFRFLHFLFPLFDSPSFPSSSLWIFIQQEYSTWRKTKMWKDTMIAPSSSSSSSSSFPSGKSPASAVDSTWQSTFHDEFDNFDIVDIADMENQSHNKAGNHVITTSQNDKKISSSSSSSSFLFSSEYGSSVDSNGIPHYANRPPLPILFSLLSLSNINEKMALTASSSSSTTMSNSSLLSSSSSLLIPFIDSLISDFFTSLCDIHTQLSNDELSSILRISTMILKGVISPNNDEGATTSSQKQYSPPIISSRMAHFVRSFSPSSLFYETIRTISTQRPFDSRIQRLTFELLLPLYSSRLSLLPFHFEVLLKRMNGKGIGIADMENTESNNTDILLDISLSVLLSLSEDSSLYSEWFRVVASNCHLVDATIFSVFHYYTKEKYSLFPHLSSAPIVSSTASASTLVHVYHSPSVFLSIFSFLFEVILREIQLGATSSLGAIRDKFWCTTMRMYLLYAETYRTVSKEWGEERGKGNDKDDDEGVGDRESLRLNQLIQYKLLSILYYFFIVPHDIGSGSHTRTNADVEREAREKLNESDNNPIAQQGGGGVGSQGMDANEFHQSSVIKMFYVYNEWWVKTFNVKGFFIIENFSGLHNNPFIKHLEENITMVYKRNPVGNSLGSNFMTRLHTLWNEILYHLGDIEIVANHVMFHTKLLKLSYSTANALISQYKNTHYQYVSSAHCSLLTSTIKVLRVLIAMNGQQRKLFFGDYVGEEERERLREREKTKRKEEEKEKERMKRMANGNKITKSKEELRVEKRDQQDREEEEEDEDIYSSYGPDDYEGTTKRNENHPTDVVPIMENTKFYILNQTGINGYHFIVKIQKMIQNIQKIIREGEERERKMRREEEEEDDEENGNEESKADDNDDKDKDDKEQEEEEDDPVASSLSPSPTPPPSSPSLLSLTEGLSFLQHEYIEFLWNIIRKVGRGVKKRNKTLLRYVHLGIMIQCIEYNEINVANILCGLQRHGIGILEDIIEKLKEMIGRRKGDMMREKEEEKKNKFQKKYEIKGKKDKKIQNINDETNSNDDDHDDDPSLDSDNEDETLENDVQKASSLLHPTIPSSSSSSSSPSPPASHPTGDEKYFIPSTFTSLPVPQTSPLSDPYENLNIFLLFQSLSSLFSLENFKSEIKPHHLAVFIDFFHHLVVYKTFYLRFIEDKERKFEMRKMRKMKMKNEGAMITADDNNMTNDDNDRGKRDKRPPRVKVLPLHFNGVVLYSSPLINPLLLSPVHWTPRHDLLYHMLMIFQSQCQYFTSTVSSSSTSAKRTQIGNANHQLAQEGVIGDYVILLKELKEQMAFIHSFPSPHQSIPFHFLLLLCSFLNSLLDYNSAQAQIFVKLGGVNLMFSIYWKEFEYRKRRRERREKEKKRRIQIEMERKLKEERERENKSLEQISLSSSSSSSSSSFSSFSSPSSSLGGDGVLSSLSSLSHDSSPYDNDDDDDSDDIDDHGPLFLYSHLDAFLLPIISISLFKSYDAYKFLKSPSSVAAAVSSSSPSYLHVIVEMIYRFHHMIPSLKPLARNQNANGIVIPNPMDNKDFVFLPKSVKDYQFLILSYLVYLSINYLHIASFRKFLLFSHHPPPYLSVHEWKRKDPKSFYAFSSSFNSSSTSSFSPSASPSDSPYHHDFIYYLCELTHLKYKDSNDFDSTSLLDRLLFYECNMIRIQSKHFFPDEEDEILQKGPAAFPISPTNSSLGSQVSQHEENGTTCYLQYPDVAYYPGYVKEREIWDVESKEGDDWSGTQHYYDSYGNIEEGEMAQSGFAILQGDGFVEIIRRIVLLSPTKEFEISQQRTLFLHTNTDRISDGLPPLPLPFHLHPSTPPTGLSLLLSSLLFHHDNMNVMYRILLIIQCCLLLPNIPWLRRWSNGRVSYDGYQFHRVLQYYHLLSVETAKQCVHHTRLFIQILNDSTVNRDVFAVTKQILLLLIHQYKSIYPHVAIMLHGEMMSVLGFEEGNMSEDEGWRTQIKEIEKASDGPCTIM